MNTVKFMANILENDNLGEYYMEAIIDNFYDKLLTSINMIVY